ncbi:mitochondrial resolvase Ydc2 [Chaetomium tenue]|uniref:Mitochondrial resolvase Ydc2 n=1 Tax=Chaetomium tenue TaxID=1854479 RepID=A0ACB7NUD1_9PEZI|nr:mitochondrial resolvase Ydc2 [Chaetomium globosum]
MTNKTLLGEKSLALKALCLSCGLRRVGTKPALVQRLRHAARNLQPITPSSRILSIDLGLKNFAFSLISPAPPAKKKQSPTSNATSLNSPIRLHAWHRLDLTLPTTTSTTKKKTKTKTTTTTTPSSDPPSPSPPPPSEEEEDAFSPAALATVTAHLIKTRLLPLRPTHVLIERQRFRTQGAAAVHEWTIRVNSLEAMLHAAFAALRGAESGGGGEGVWEGRVESVLPKTVAEFLFAGDDVEGGEEEGGGKGKATAGKAYLKLKKKKVEMLGGYLADGGIAVPEKGQATEMVRLFKEKVERRRGGKGKGGGRKKVASVEGVEGVEVEEAITKMDDLSDAVLQGMVWLQWRRNLEALTKEWPELLEEET